MKALLHCVLVTTPSLPPERKVNGSRAGTVPALATRVAVSNCSFWLLYQLMTAWRFAVTVKTAVLTSCAVTESMPLSDGLLPVALRSVALNPATVLMTSTT